MDNAKCINTLRHEEYYGMQEVLDVLYERSMNGEVFTDLFETVFSRENILMAYRNIKSNSGSNTPGTDNLSIKDIGRLSPEEVVEKVRSIVSGKNGYRPKPVRRKEIPKPDGSARPLGIPCIWDRLIQQCIRQVLEPICEAKFSENSYGFRPLRSAENAVAAMMRLVNQSHLHYVVEFDIKGFFDNVDHTKLVRQIWTMGIHDKRLIYIIKEILKAPIRMPDGSTVYPTKGTPQGGIISPLLANIVLNELDQWIDSQWQDNPVARKYKSQIHANGSLNLGNGYRAMRKTNLKEMYIVRYADDFRILCRSRQDAQKVMAAVTQWLEERLRLEVSPGKTRIVNVRRKRTEFLGFSIKAKPKAGKHVARSRMCEKAYKKAVRKLVEQARHVARPRKGRTERDEVLLYNAMVMGIQNYYSIATDISLDCRKINRAVMVVFTNRLGKRLKRKGRPLTETEEKRYGRSRMLRYVAGSEEPLYPAGFIQYRNPLSKKRRNNLYIAEGRTEIHKGLEVNLKLMMEMMRQPQRDRSTEYADNRISLFSAQHGKCAVTGAAFQSAEEIHCHHKTPRRAGGTDEYSNLILVTETVHRLIHAVAEDTVKTYKTALNLDKDQLAKLNRFRELAGNKAV